MSSAFIDLGLSEQTLETLQTKGFEEATPIQAKTIPLILNSSKDVIGQAQTGTGKTAAFGLPLVELLNEKSKVVQAIVLVPTRELAIQVAEEIHSLKGRRRLSIVPIYGGQSITLQLRSLRQGVDIVVGTPGRVIDHLKRKSLKVEDVSFLVLDEADEMLNMGFLEDVQEIMSKTNPDKRTLLFSATMPRQILNIAKTYMKDYEMVKVQGELTSNNTSQIYFEVREGNKFEALCRIVDMEDEFYGVIFCKTKVDSDNVANHLKERGYQADAIHGDVTQALRQKILNKFKRKSINILVATDVAARGIDVQGISHVINYSLPHDPEAYVHRIGRTGRAGKMGIAITFVTPSEYRRLQFIQKKAQTAIEKKSLPKVQDIIDNKKKRIKDQILSVVDQEPKTDYLDLAKDLLKDIDSPEVLLASLLQVSFQGALDAETYPAIEDHRVDNKGKTRLFVRYGKKDGLTMDMLSTLLKEQCNVAKSRINNVEIFDEFSFVSLPFQEAEDVLEYFRNNKSKSGLYITKAKSDRGDKGRGGRGGSRGGRGREGYRGRDGERGGRSRSGGRSSSRQRSTKRS